MTGSHSALTLEMKRMAPTETNTWERGARDGGWGAVSTKEPKTFWRYRRQAEQTWEKTDLGFAMPFKTITGGVFEPGFPDLLQQMWAAFLTERAGSLGTIVSVARHRMKRWRIMKSGLRR